MGELFALVFLGLPIAMALLALVGYLIVVSLKRFRDRHRRLEEDEEFRIFQVCEERNES